MWIYINMDIYMNVNRKWHVLRRPSHLYASLVELGDSGQLLSVVDVRILILSKSHLQLFQLLVAEGGAVSPPGWGGVSSALPAQADSHGGLTQWPLPRRLTYICFQQGENEFEASAPVSGLPWHDTRNAASACKGAFHQSLREKRGDYTDSVVPTATRQPESYGALREKDTRTGGIWPRLLALRLTKWLIWQIGGLRRPWLFASWR